MIEYTEGNEAAGEELKQNTNLNVGITLGVGVFSASAKGVVKTAAKSKVVKELGEEIAERLLKNTDDATNITKYLKKIKKAGVSQDAIKRVADTSGEAGLKWLEKQTKEGISKEVLEKIAKNANDCTKYTDELIEIIGLYEGRTDDIIEYVNKNGDDGVEEIFRLYESGKNSNEVILPKETTHDLARKSLLKEIDKTGAFQNGSKKYIGRLESSYGYGKQIGRQSFDGKVRWRLDYDEEIGVHYNFEDFSNGKGVNAIKKVIPIEISYDEYTKILDLWN